MCQLNARKPQKALNALALCTTLACTVVHSDIALAKDDRPAVALEAGTAMPANLVSAFELPNPEQFKGVKLVVVPEFSIEFLTDNGASSTNGNTSVSQVWRLRGVGPAEYQAITDAAYSALLRSLVAAGYEVVPSATMLAHPAYAKMSSAGKPTGLRTDSGIAMAPSGMVVMPLGTVSARQSNSAGPLGALQALQTIGTIAGSLGGESDVNEMARALDATVLRVRIATDFSQVGAERGLLQRLSGKASVSGKAQPTIKAGATALRVFTPQQKAAQIMLANPLLLPEDTFVETREATSAATVAGDVAGALLRLGAGISGGSQTKEYEVVAEPAQYTLRMSEGMNQLAQGMVARLAAATR